MLTYSYTDTNLASDTIYAYSVQAVVVDENNITFNGQVGNVAYLSTLSNSNNTLVIGAAVGAVAAVLLILSGMFCIYRMTHKVKQQVEEMRIESVAQVAEMTNFQNPKPTVITDTNSSSDVKN